MTYFDKILRKKKKTTKNEARAYDFFIISRVLRKGKE